ncbi:hypothetical protein FHX15_005157 [Rhizobium sp. BK650]|uniref:hypothetical protein n=1 Tax=Rhizobium sp. BK650 TaxID=2586990 RepID=UPI00160A269F|nr:hypothetical protein [Rhizobium sp. BK650]MBB3659888.1 hypothetical protein [Rhizobium sp. BK650]
MHQSVQEKTEGSPTGEEKWNVFDFARRYRLAKSEENRLLALFGTMASPRDLLLNARRAEMFG